MRRDIAERVSLVVLEQSAQLDAIARLLQSTTDEEECAAFRLGIGKVMAEMLFELLNPIYAQHPDLQPEGMGGPYRVDQRIYDSAKRIAPLPVKGP